MSGLRRTHRRDEIKDVYGPGVIPTATHAPGERAPRHDPHLQEGMATRSKRQARFWSAILSRLLLGMGFGALGSLMVNCALVEISLSPLFAVAFGAQCPTYAQCPVALPKPDAQPMSNAHSPGQYYHQVYSSCCRAARSRGRWRSSRAVGRAVCCCLVLQPW